MKDLKSKQPDKKDSSPFRSRNLPEMSNPYACLNDQVNFFFHMALSEV